MSYAPRPEQLETREEAVRIAMHYPRGLSEAQTFDAIGTPFSDSAYRLENGALMAGPGCSFAPGCEDIGGQSLAIFRTLGRVTVRDVVVDERMGIVMMRLSWNVRGPGSDKLTEVLHALVAHDASGLAVAEGLRVTEDGVEKPLAQVGLVRSVTKLRGYRQDVIDERAGVAVAGAMVEEAGAPVILAVRVKVDGAARLSELELVATRSRTDGLLFNIDGMGAAPSTHFTRPPVSGRYT